MSHIFLSYSRSDRGLAGRLREDLSAGGLDVWSDRRLGLGGSWLAAISVAIDEARAVVLLATPTALASKWVMGEVEAARVLGKPVVPLLAGGSRFGDLPASLAGINGVDLADGYEDSVTGKYLKRGCWTPTSGNIGEPVQKIRQQAVTPDDRRHAKKLTGDDSLGRSVIGCGAGLT